MDHNENLQFLHELHAAHRARKEAFYKRTTERRAQLLTAIKNARNRSLDNLFRCVADIRSASPELAELLIKIRAYFDHSDWAFIDLVALAACTTVSVDEVATTMAPNALVYHSLRMLDDVLDGHHDYKGGARTLLGELSLDRATAHRAPHANLITAMLITASVSATLTDPDRHLLERTLIGMLHESFPGDWRTREGYRQIAWAKMGAYGLFLYRPVLLMFEAATGQALERFLGRSLLISQFVNDLQDWGDDEAREQPNYWLIGGSRNESMADLGCEIRRLASSCAEIPQPARDYAHTRVTDLIGYLFQVLHADAQSRSYRTVQAS